MEANVISTIYSANEIASNFLRCKLSTVLVVVKGVDVGRESGEITLVSIGNLMGDAYIFDVQRNPGIMHEALDELFECEKIRKVLFDSSGVCATLYWQYGTVTTNVIDIQAMYSSIRAVSEGLSVERVQHLSLSDMHARCYDGGTEDAAEFSPLHSEMEQKTFWQILKRPMSTEMNRRLASEVKVLRQLYDVLKRGLPDSSYKNIAESSMELAHKKIRKNITLRTHSRMIRENT